MRLPDDDKTVLTTQGEMRSLGWLGVYLGFVLGFISAIAVGSVVALIVWGQ